MRTESESRHFIARLGKLTAIREQLAALSEVTGVELRLVAVADWPPHKRREDCRNPFCDLMIRAGLPCAACDHAERTIAAHAVKSPQTVTCLGGLCQSAVPLRVDGATFGFVEFGPLTLGEPSEKQFDQTLALLKRWKTDPQRDRLRPTLFESPALSAQRHEAVVRVLIMFAQQASLIAQQLRFSGVDGEPRAVAAGRKYIDDHHREPLTLPEVARAAKVSTSYFSRMFKKATAQTFTDYLARIRIEQARQLLRNSDARVGEVAFAVGFQSIPHFNRVFKKMTRESPREFRAGAGVHNPQSKNA